MQHERTAGGLNITGVVAVEIGSCYSGPLHTWARNIVEGDVQFVSLFQPLDACSVLVQQCWKLDEPLHVGWARAGHTTVGICKVTSTRSRLFYPLLPGRAGAATVRDLRGYPSSLARALASVSSELEHAFDDVHADENIDVGVLCLMVPVTISQLMFRGMWQEVLVLARWLLPPSHIRHGHVLRRRAALAFGDEWQSPVGCQGRHT